MAVPARGVGAAGGKAVKAGKYFSGRLERTREPVSGCRNDYEHGIPPGEISGGDAGTRARGKRTKRVHALDGCRRNGVQTDRRTDRAKGCLLEETGRKGGSRREDWAGTIWVACGRGGGGRGREDWAGTIRVACGRVGAERGRDPG